MPSAVLSDRLPGVVHLLRRHPKPLGSDVLLDGFTDIQAGGPQPGLGQSGSLHRVDHVLAFGEDRKREPLDPIDIRLSKAGYLLLGLALTQETLYLFGGELGGHLRSSRSRRGSLGLLLRLRLLGGPVALGFVVGIFFFESGYFLESIFQPGIDAYDKPAGSRPAFVGEYEVLEIGRETDKMKSDHCLQFARRAGRSTSLRT
jgi:hypothetical protein